MKIDDKDRLKIRTYICDLDDNLTVDKIPFAQLRAELDKIEVANPKLFDIHIKIDQFENCNDMEVYGYSLETDLAYENRIKREAETAKKIEQKKLKDKALAEEKEIKRKEKELKEYNRLHKIYGNKLNS